MLIHTFYYTANTYENEIANYFLIVPSSMVLLINIAIWFMYFSQFALKAYKNKTIFLFICIGMQILKNLNLQTEKLDIENCSKRTLRIDTINNILKA